MAVRITCINKDGGFHENPHVAISDLGWTNETSGEAGHSTRDAMYNFVLGGGIAYVRDRAGNTAYLMAKVSARGTHFVQTHADGTPTDNLLYLSECRQ
jgi:hypothetical protein